MTMPDASPLTQRLLRRGTKPVGVIDVRASQDRYARANAWARQHVTMLDRATARQQTDATTGQDPRLLLPSRALDAREPLRDIVPLSPASMARVAARQHSSTPDTPAAARTASHDDDPSRASSRGELIVG